MKYLFNVVVYLDEYQIIILNLSCTDLKMSLFFLDNSEPKLANHVLQLSFVGFTGFKFPIAQFPNREAASYEIMNIFWKAVDVLDDWGFKVSRQKCFLVPSLSLVRPLKYLI